MQDDNEVIEGNGRKPSNGQTRKGVVRWWWLIIVAVLAFRAGETLQASVDEELMNKAAKVITECKKVLDGLDLQDSGVNQTSNHPTAQDFNHWV